MSWYNPSQHQEPGRMSQKRVGSPAQPQRAKTHVASGKAAGALARRAYTEVREHEKGPRTQPADSFNILPAPPGALTDPLCYIRFFIHPSQDHEFGMRNKGETLVTSWVSEHFPLALKLSV